MTLQQLQNRSTRIMRSVEAKVTSYVNPWHRPGRPEYGPAMYETTARGREYRGFMIYERVSGKVWDVVRDGACLTQMAGPNGARRAVDAILARETAAA